MPSFMHAFVHDIKHGISAISTHPGLLLSMMELISRHKRKRRCGLFVALTVVLTRLGALYERRDPAFAGCAEVIAGSGENSVDAVAEASLEMISVHAVLGLDVANDGLDSRATLHLARDGSCDAADLTRDPDPEPMRVVVTAISFFDVDTASLHPRELLHVGDYRTERVPIEGIAMQGLGMEHELAALRRRHRGDDADLAAELIGRAGFTLADSLNLRSM